jgi:hypothetical protein
VEVQREPPTCGVRRDSNEPDALSAGLRKIQARLSATEDEDELAALVAERMAIKARIEGFAIVPDSFDYAPTGRTVAGMWIGDDAVKRNMVKAVRGCRGLALAAHEGQWGIKIDTDSKSGDLGEKCRVAQDSANYSLGCFNSHGFIRSSSHMYALLSSSSAFITHIHLRTIG